MGLPFSIDVFDQIADEICRVGQRMWQQGFCAGSDGNISARLNEELIVITPSGVSKAHMHASMMSVLRINDGSIVHGTHRPSSERSLHLAIYRARPNMEAVIHSHAPMATVWACTGEAVPDGIHPEKELLLGQIPVVPYVTPGSGRLGEVATQTLKPATCAMLLANHGTLTFGDSLEEALQRLEMLEAYCRIVVELRRLGGNATRRLTTDEMSDLLRIKSEYWHIPDDRTPQ